MPSLTIKNLSGSLVERLRERAAADQRSLNRELIYLLERALAAPQADPAAARSTLVESEAETQVAAWSRLAGGWRSNEDPEVEIQRITDRRGRRRPVDL
jgi:plasmid stability protein